MAIVSIMTATIMRFQFSLKSYLCAMLCISLLVGLVVRIASTIASKNAAIDAIAAEADGRVIMFSGDGRVITGRGDGDPYTIDFLSCREPTAIARTLRRCAYLKSVREVNLGGAELVPECFVGVPPNVRVQVLSLECCTNLTPEICALLIHSFPQVRDIRLRLSDVTLGGLEVLSKAKYARKLDVSWLPISGAEVVHACQQFPALTHLVINHTNLFGELKHLCTLSSLEVVDLSLSDFSECDLAGFVNCTACKEVRLICVEVDREAVEGLVNQKDKLSILDWGLPPN